MYERRHEPLLPRRAFYRRLGRHAAVAAATLAVALAVGMAGYHFFEDESWLDAYADAAMILSGMGPLGPLKTRAGKLFAGSYAIFSGVIFLTSIGVFIAPIGHRLFHNFHLKLEAEPKSKS